MNSFGSITEGILKIGAAAVRPTVQSYCTLSMVMTKQSIFHRARAGLPWLGFFYRDQCWLSIAPVPLAKIH